MKTSQSMANRSDRARILVVEDERLVALDIQRTLIELGYRVAGSAARGEDAVRKARAARPDLVLMDIRLDGPMDGIDAASAIQKELQIPVIYLSAFSDADTMRRAGRAAPSGFLLKPFNQAELVCAVDMALGRRAVEANACEAELVNRATEEIPSSRLKELLGSTGLHEFPGDRWRTQDMPLFEEFAPLDTAVRVETSPADRDRLREKLDTLGAVTGTLTHDFNNILSTILANGQILLEGMDADDPRCLEVEEMCRAAERGAALTQSLLALSRRQVPRPSLVDLNAMVRTMEKEIRGLLGREIDVSLRLAARPGTVKADRAQMELAIANLVLNAREAMPAGGRLVVETADVEGEAASPASPAPGRFVMIAIGDTGCGMSAETQRRAFEPFFTTKDRGRRTGLGLSTAYSVVDQNGGQVSLQSEPGRGTVVRIYLPEADAAVLPVSTAVTDLTLVGSETILLVEDDAGVQSAIGRILLGRGYRVLMASGAQAALELADSHDGAIDLVLGDLDIADLIGPEFAARMSALESGPSLLFMSGPTDHAMLADGSLADAGHHVQKPFAPEALLGKVRALLDRRAPRDA